MVHGHKLINMDIQTKIENKKEELNEIKERMQRLKKQIQEARQNLVKAQGVIEFLQEEQKVDND